MEEQNNIQAKNKAVLLVLQDARNDINHLYGNDPDLQGHKLRIGTALTRLVQTLSNLEGMPHEAGAVAQTQFPPVTNFMGEELQFAKQYVSADIANPNADEIQQFQKKVEDLYVSMPGLPMANILRDYKGNANLELVLRGVARMAGVQNYLDAPINEAYYSAIIDGISKKEAEQEFKDQQEDILMEQMNKQPAPEQIELTAAHLIAFPHLVEQGKRVGDKVAKSELDVPAAKTPPAPATPALKPVTEWVSRDAADNLTDVQTNEEGVVTGVTMTNPGPIVPKVVEGGTGYEGQEPAVVNGGSGEAATIKSVNKSDTSTDKPAADAKADKKDKTDTKADKKDKDDKNK